jgi:hypothetical protein
MIISSVQFSSTASRIPGESFKQSTYYMGIRNSTVIFAGFFLTLLAAQIISSCTSNDSGSDVSCSSVSVTFTQANTIIQSSCATKSDCHGSGSSEGPGELLSYAQIFAARSDIRSVVSSGEMPKNGSLSGDERNTIICWIENGAAN